MLFKQTLPSLYMEYNSLCLLCHNIIVCHLIFGGILEFPTLLIVEDVAD